MASEFFENGSAEYLHRLKQMAGLDHPCRELERLTSMQHQLSRSYFRLLEAGRGLQTRAHSVPKSAGTMLIDSIEADRRRLGRELHTGVGQSLAGIHVHVEIIEAQLADPPEPVRQSLDRILRLADTALEQVRGVSRDLYVPAWQAHSLVDALRQLWETSGISEKFAGSLDLRELSSEPAPELRRALYLAAQEGISNVLQHSYAHRVRLSLRQEDGRLTLEIEDDGSGFSQPAEPPSDASTGIGLRALRDLSRELGGELQALNGPQGARLTISFPVLP